MKPRGIPCAVSTADGSARHSVKAADGIRSRHAGAFPSASGILKSLKITLYIVSCEA